MTFQNLFFDLINYPSNRLLHRDEKAMLAFELKTQAARIVICGFVLEMFCTIPFLLMQCMSGDGFGEVSVF